MLTFDDEVSQIWPQPTWKMGKILFLATRYTASIYMAHLLVLNWPHHTSISVHGCEGLGLVMNVAGMMTRIFAEGTLWLCLYALLGGNPKFFWLLVVAFLVFTIPASVLNGMHVMSQRAIPQNHLDHLLGYPCNFLPPQRPDLAVIASYIIFARTCLALIVGLATLVVRYRKQNHNLIRVIRREGGMYYISTLILMFFSCLTSTRGSPVKDKYSIVWSLRLLMNSVFADRLLLKMKKVDDRSTQAVISTLMFNHDDGQLSSSSYYTGDLDEEAYTDEGEPSTQEKAERIAAVDMSEKALGKRVEA
ncbi:hypothetical protein FA13DRAFT_1741612 [Coprinellus micaceus]|uniref:DUF6533 domain-containing protein n=1 Tax=Coprinellus micaceus TaxID=71717 RepID=A0A4Y7SIU3_COPMI|nr:hypothetical protein FA13DRAFT_1741612 [Coprinellus micaceus]